MFEEMIVLFAQLGHRMSGEKISSHAVSGGFPPGGLGTVFAELSVAPRVRAGIRPRTTWAVETFRLIKSDQRPRPSAYSHFTHRGP
jgi:hypothetical protein